MKKFAFLALVAALVLALTVPAAIAETKIGGSYRVRGIYWDQGLDNGKFNNDVAGTGRYFDNRLRLNIDSKVTDTLAVHVEADSGLGYNGRNGDFQNPAATPDSYDGIWNKGGSFVNLPEPGSADRDTSGEPGHDIVFQQAYMDFATPIGAFSIGRQWSFWGLGLMVGENRNRLAWSYQIPQFQIGAGYDKFFEGDTMVLGNNVGAFTKRDDQDNYFIWALASGDNWQFGPYFEYTHTDHLGTGGTAIGPTTNPAAATLEGVDTYGISVYGNVTFGPLTIAAEGAYRGGTADQLMGAGLVQDYNFNAYAGAGRATYAINGLTIGGEGGYISGQDKDENSEFQAFITPFSFSPFAILGEFAINGLDLLGNASYLPSASGTGSYSDFCSNMIYGKGFIQASPIEKLDAYLAIGYAVTAQDPFLNSTDNTLGTRNDQLGTEVDLSLTYAITPNLSYNFTGAYLFTGDFYDNANEAMSVVGTGGLGTVEANDAMLAVHSITVNW